MNNLSVKQKQYLKSLAHTLDPVVYIGANGVTSNIIKEINNSLEAHELIKIKIFNNDKIIRSTLIDEICSQLSVELVQKIGKLIVLFRSSKKQKIKLP